MCGLQFEGALKTYIRIPHTHTHTRTRTHTHTHTGHTKFDRNGLPLALGGGLNDPLIPVEVRV